MDRARAIRILKQHQTELVKRGVQHVALFGSLARDEGDAASDVDLMIDLEPDAKISMFDYVDLVEYVQGLFTERVDVANRESLKPHVRPSAERDAINVF